MYQQKTQTAKDQIKELKEIFDSKVRNIVVISVAVKSLENQETLTDLKTQYLNLIGEVAQLKPSRVLILRDICSKGLWWDKTARIMQVVYGILCISTLIFRVRFVPDSTNKYYHYTMMRTQVLSWQDLRVASFSVLCFFLKR